MLTVKGPQKPYSPPREDSVIELSLMMSRRQFDALERQARSYGMSVAHFLRRLVQENIDQEERVACSS